MKKTFLKECMADALISLMEKNDVSKITINEIAEVAGVNRSTWFRNFETKSEALTYKIVCLWSRWSSQHIDLPTYTVDNAGDFFEFCFENRKLLSLIFSTSLQSSVYEAFYQIMMPQFETKIEECYESRYYSHGLFGLLGEWNKRGYKETPCEMVEIFHKIMIKKSV